MLKNETKKYHSIVGSVWGDSIKLMYFSLQHTLTAMGFFNFFSGILRKWFVNTKVLKVDNNAIVLWGYVLYTNILHCLVRFEYYRWFYRLDSYDKYMKFFDTVGSFLLFCLFLVIHLKIQSPDAEKNILKEKKVVGFN